MNSTDGLGTGPLACADYAANNRQTYYASFANGPTIVNGTFLYTDSALTTPIPDGYRSDGTTYWNFQGGDTGDNGSPCNTTTTTTTAAPTTTTTTAAPTTTTTTLAIQSYDLYYPCGTTTPASLRAIYDGTQSPGNIILASNGLCYTVAGETTTGGATLTIVSEHSTCEDCEAARPTTTTTSTTTTTTSTTTTTLPPLVVTGNNVCSSLPGACDGQINITNITGGSGTGYQTRLNGGSWNNYPATNSYTGVCGGTTYTLDAQDSVGTFESSGPFVLCANTTTTTTTTTTAAPVTYYELSECSPGTGYAWTAIAPDLGTGQRYVLPGGTPVYYTYTGASQSASTPPSGYNASIQKTTFTGCP